MDSEYNERLKRNARVDELNALALAEAIAAYRAETDERLLALENSVETLKGLVDKQTQTIGVAVQQVWGSGSTVPDPNPEDMR